VEVAVEGREEGEPALVEGVAAEEGLAEPDSVAAEEAARGEDWEALARVAVLVVVVVVAWEGAGDSEEEAGGSSTSIGEDTRDVGVVGAAREAEWERERLRPHVGGACLESLSCLTRLDLLEERGTPLAGGFLSVEEDRETIVERKANLRAYVERVLQRAKNSEGVGTNRVGFVRVRPEVVGAECLDDEGI